jgi:phosphoglycolate phosphatase
MSETAPPEKPRALLLFDLDGTLVDTSGDIVHSANHLRGRMGLEPLPAPDVLAEVGRGAGYLVEHVTGVEDGSGPGFTELLDEFKLHYLRHQSERSVLYPGAVDALVSLRRDAALYVLSNKPHAAVLREVELHGIDHFFDDVWGAGALDEIKPDPLGIELAMRRSGVPPERTLMIGDMEVDLETAANARVRSVLVDYGFGSPGPDSPRPAAVVGSLPELEQTVRRLLMHQ